MNNAKKSRVASNRRAVIVGAFFLLCPVVFYSLSPTEQGSLDARVTSAEYALGRYLENQVGMQRGVDSSRVKVLQRSIFLLPRGSVLRSRWQVLASIAYNVSRQNEDCDPAIGGEGERASCLLKRGCLERAGVLYNGLISGKAGIYVKKLIEKLSRNHKIRCRS